MTVSIGHLGLTSDLGINAKLWIGLFNALDSGWKWTGGSPFRYLNWAPGKCTFLK